MMSSSGDEASAVADRQEPPQQLLRHLDSRHHLGVLLGVAEDDDQAQREVRDVGEGAADAEDERRQRREDLRLEQLVELGTLLLGRRRRSVTIPIPCSSSAGSSSLSKHSSRRSRCASERSRIGGDLVARPHPVGAAGRQRRLDLVVQARHPDHVELVEVVLVDRAELDPLEQRERPVLGELQDPVVEVHPRELAVEEERGILEVDGGVRVRLLAPSALRRLVLLDRLGARLHRPPTVERAMSTGPLRSGERVQRACVRRRSAPARRRSSAATRASASEYPSASCSSETAQLRSRAAASAAADEALAQRRALGEAEDLGGHLLGARLAEQPASALLDQVGRAAGANGDDRYAAGLRLDHDLAVGVGLEGKAKTSASAYARARSSPSSQPRNSAASPSRSRR